ncbi:MAG: hypothetical protein D6E12_09710 [Desulfovibrio sp.]|nr:MAG: hypothetical protein D6E12_09710 [Desulfovibrio sp.]
MASQETQAMTQALEEVEETKLLPAVLEPPKEFDQPEIKVAEEKALVVVENVLKDPEDRSAVRDATSLGEQIQDQANKDFALLRTSLGKVMDRMKETGDSSAIPADLKKLRVIMDDINPFPAIEQMKKARNAGFLSRMFRRIPGLGKILADIAMRYESVQTQIDAIIQSLEGGSDKLLENVIEIEERYKSLKALQQDVKLSAYQLQYMVKKLEETQPTLEDETKKMAVNKAITKIMRRLQNLKVTENAFAQFFVTMNTTMDNHENLRDSIRSMIDLVRPVLENGLALKIAQQDERQIAEALEATQDYLGSLMVSVAEESMDNAAKIAEVTNKPLAKFQDLVKAYQILTTRMDDAAKIEAKMVEAAKQNIAELETMSEELEKRAHAQEAGREASRAAEKLTDR